VTPAAGQLCKSFGLEVPIFQAGMGWVSTGPLAAAVSGAGGLGVIATGGFMGSAELREHIARVRDEAPGKPFGVNVLLPSGGTADVEFGSPDIARIHLDVCFAEEVPVIVSGLGDPRPILPEIRAHGARFVAVVGSLRAARNVAGAGADAVIVQGNEAGGHVGPTGTLTLAQAAIHALDAPVLLAGGIATAEAVAAALALGAAGVSVGTRFLASDESDAHPSYKQAIVDADERATVITRACTGKPSRALRTPWVESWVGREDEIEPYPEQAATHFWRSRAGCVDGDWEQGFFPAGQCASVIDAVLPAATILENLASVLLAA
jgi:enoyl-[acyl-carrier protein] reductase II